MRSALRTSRRRPEIGEGDGSCGAEFMEGVSGNDSEPDGCREALWYLCKVIYE
ncbi:hypothetical protein RE428_38810 [Marinobacter nanhaiticus D15-8W]|nr:hypothetical protein RE428_38810 [Marinobacter nanhaiticus D15-8W]